MRTCARDRRLSNKVSADAPLTQILYLARRNAYRVPALVCGWENLYLLLRRNIGNDAFVVFVKFLTVDNFAVARPPVIAESTGRCYSFNQKQSFTIYSDVRRPIIIPKTSFILCSCFSNPSCFRKTSLFCALVIDASKQFLTVDPIIANFNVLFGQDTKIWHIISPWTTISISRSIDCFSKQRLCFFSKLMQRAFHHNFACTQLVRRILDEEVPNKKQNECYRDLKYAFKESTHTQELTNLGTSDNPVVTGSSHRPANLVTAFPLGGCCLKCTHHRYAYKRIYDIINSMIPNKVDRSIA